MRQYHIYDGQTKKGPYTLEQLKTLSLSKDTPVWYEGLKDWSTAENINDLNELFAKKITPPPLPQTFEKNINSRREIFDSFGDAEELFIEKKGNRYLIPFIITLIIIAGIVYTIFFRGS